MQLIMKVLLIENGFGDLIKSRVPFGNFLEQRGFDVSYACPNPKGSGYFHVPMTRASFSPSQIFSGLKALTDLEKKLNPQCVVSYRLMPNMLNFIRSINGVSRTRIAVITGLGQAFVTEKSSSRNHIIRLFIGLFYRVAQTRLHIIVQNPDDAETLGLTNATVILGSGVKAPIAYKKNFDHSLSLLFVGRLLKSKGISTAVKIFQKLRLQNPHATLIIAGTIDASNPDSLSKKELKSLTEQEGIQYLGFVSDLEPIYRRANVLLFPSIYREGVPRVIIESLAHGLTIVSTNTPGCKETVRENGLLLDNSIDKAVQYLGQLTPEKLKSNAIQSRLLFDQTFSDVVIYPQYFQVIEKALKAT